MRISFYNPFNSLAWLIRFGTKEFSVWHLDTGTNTVCDEVRRESTFYGYTARAVYDYDSRGHLHLIGWNIKRKFAFIALSSFRVSKKSLSKP